MKVILASQSPRRRDLLAMVGITHDVVVPNIDESHRAGELPDRYATRVALEKVQAVAASPADVVIAADTIVVIDGAILGKPSSRDDAVAALQMLSGRTHSVYTAVAVRHGTRTVSACDRVSVTFRALSSGEINSYIDTGEPMDKAGSYGIQGFGATIVERIDGDYFAVMGLSLVRTVRLLAALGLDYNFAAGVHLTQRAY